MICVHKSLVCWTVWWWAFTAQSLLIYFFGLMTGNSVFWVTGEQTKNFRFFFFVRPNTLDSCVCERMWIWLCVWEWISVNCVWVYEDICVCVSIYMLVCMCVCKSPVLLGVVSGGGLMKNGSCFPSPVDSAEQPRTRRQINIIHWN